MVTCTEKEVLALLDNSTDEEILASHTKEQLRMMYMTVFECLWSPSGWRKQDFLQHLREYSADAV